MPDTNPTVPSLSAPAAADTAAPPATLRGAIARAANYLVDDIHIKGPVLLGAAVMGYGFFHPEQMQACKDYALYLSAVVGGAAIAPKK